MVKGRADSTLGTWAFLAQWKTFLSDWSRRIVTNLIGGTILVGGAFDLNARNLRISLQSSRTVAHCPVELYLAKGIASTDCAKTRIHTFFWSTCLVQGAISILLALI
jgi:hypothetical protein